MTSLADLIVQLQADAKKQKRKRRNVAPRQASIGRGDEYMDHEHAVLRGHHMPLLYEERPYNQ